MHHQQAIVECGVVTRTQQRQVPQLVLAALGLRHDGMEIQATGGVCRPSATDAPGAHVDPTGAPSQLGRAVPGSAAGDEADPGTIPAKICAMRSAIST